VLLTTHSPYVVDHINNLTEAGLVDQERRHELARHFKLKSANAFLNPKDVSVYHFAMDGQVTDVYLRQENVIDSSTFGDVSSFLQGVYHKAIQAQKEQVGV
jgi:hypothetical protein